MPPASTLHPVTRWVYFVENNPINFSDPSGYCTQAHYSTTIVSDTECETTTNNSPSQMTALSQDVSSSSDVGTNDAAGVATAYFDIKNKAGINITPDNIANIFNWAGINISGDWSFRDEFAAAWAVIDIGFSLMMSGWGNSWVSAFRNAMSKKGSTATMNWVGSKGGGDGGLTGGLSTDYYALCHNSGLVCARGNVVHELGHVFNNAVGTISMQGEFVDKRYSILRPNGTMYEGSPIWQYHKDNTSPGETFADFFVAWTFNVWNDDTYTYDTNNPTPYNAREWMYGYMQK